MSEWQVAISLGQVIGTVGAIMIFIRSIKTDLSKLQENHNKRLETLQKEHYEFREKVAGEYLRRDEWLSHHNKLEAKLDKRLDEIEKLLRGEK